MQLNSQNHGSLTALGLVEAKHLQPCRHRLRSWGKESRMTARPRGAEVRDRDTSSDVKWLSADSCARPPEVIWGASGSASDLKPVALVRCTRSAASASVNTQIGTHFSNFVGRVQLLTSCIAASCFRGQAPARACPCCSGQTQACQLCEGRQGQAATE